MASITRRRTGELIQALFRVLSEHPEGLPANAAIAEVEAKAPPTEFERADYPNRPGVRRFDKIVRFATIAPVKAGWLTKEKGRWTLTAEGGRALERHASPEALIGEAARRYREWRQSQPDVQGDEEEAPAGYATLEEAEETAWSEVREHLQRLSPYDFQDLVVALLEAMGYHVHWKAPPGPDLGIDILASTDPLGTSTPRIKVQVKNRIDKTAVDGLRAFLAQLGEDDVGIFVSAGGFTRDAEVEARQQERRRVTLLDLGKLFDLWVEYYTRIPDSSRNLLPLRPVYFLSARV
ncbi:MAG: restriction endonuclease [Actinobacteria bacterium]|nr:restriction endonuclease [Actinomycetota bacterium]